jgi:outer membrane protein assembly factor BamB
MKKFISIALFLVSSIALGQEFPIAWKTKFSFEPTRWYYTPDGLYVLGRSPEQAEMLDGLTGKPIWKLNFKNDLKVKELARANYNPDKGFILFFNPDEKKKNGEKVIVDFKTGKELWRTTAYAGVDADDNFHFAHAMGDIATKGVAMLFDNESKKFIGIDVLTGVKKWESKAYPSADLTKNIIINKVEDSDYAQVIIADEKDLLKTEVFFMNVVTGEQADSSGFTSSPGNYTRQSSGKIIISRTVGNTGVKLTGTMKKLAPTKINFELKMSGDVNWSKEFEGHAVRQLFNDAPYVKMDIQGNKIFVLAKQITVFDLKTGNQLWQVPFDNCDVSVGLRAKQEFGIASWPLVDGNYIYYVDLQNDNAIKKVEAQTGKVVWAAPVNKGSRIPNLLIVNGVLIAQFGGMINTQTYSKVENTEVWKSENQFDGDFGVKAYDVNSGSLIWDSKKLADKLGDKFSNRITSIYSEGNNIYVASDKNLFSLNAKTGDIIYKTPLSASKIGDVFQMLFSDDNKTFYIFCDNGIAAADIATGKLSYATKTGEIYWKAPPQSYYSFSYGNNYFVWVGEKDFIGFDLATGTVKGKMKDNSDPQNTEDGNYIFVRDGEKITKYAVNQQ